MLRYTPPSPKLKTFFLELIKLIKYDGPVVKPISSAQYTHVLLYLYLGLYVLSRGELPDNKQQEAGNGEGTPHSKYVASLLGVVWITRNGC